MTILYHIPRQMRRGGAMPGHYDGRKERSEWSVRRAKDVADPALVMPARGCPRRPAQRCMAEEQRVKRVRAY